MHYKKNILLLGTILHGANVIGNHLPDEGNKPNFIIIFTDDLGYGDLGCYGSTIHETPNIDKMASNGILFTDFYVTAPVCTPSRASLLTGCYPKRIDMDVNEKPADQFRAVLTPQSPKGLSPSEITIAEVLKTEGYKTACVGKWHLGDQKMFFPTNHGFDYFYGILHSHNQGSEDCPLVIFEQEEIVESPVEIPLLTRKMTEKSIEFIENNSEDPFFLYLPHPMPHFPLAASDPFLGKSEDGIYGDAILELDWSVGELIKTLDELKLLQNTIIVFTSDNGGETREGMVKGGFNFPLKGHKGETWEGGTRVPCIIQWSGKIAGGKTCDVLASEMDFLPTFADIAGATLPENPIDGKNIMELLLQPEVATSPYEVFYYYNLDQLQAIRWKNWKLHLGHVDGRYPASWKNDLQPFREHLLFDLNRDITETWNVADEYPEIVGKMLQFAEQAREEIGDRNINGKGKREAGFVESTVCPVMLFD
jgi:arylsulfatase A-like enzyme